MESPFYYFGSKRQIAPYIWDRFGSIKLYFEPFGGGLSVLLARPEIRGYEIVNDNYHFIINFWRSVKYDPEGVATEGCMLRSEAEAKAAFDFLITESHNLQKCLEDINFYDVKSAARWYALWSKTLSARNILAENASRIVFYTRRNGPDLQKEIRKMQAISERLTRNTIIKYGDWKRCLPSAAEMSEDRSSKEPVAVFLDPPYSTGHEKIDEGIYHNYTSVHEEVRQWALTTAESNPLVRIILAGHEEEHDMPGWSTHLWNPSHPGMSARGKSKIRNECLWMSPACLPESDSPWGF